MCFCVAWLESNIKHDDSIMQGVIFHKNKWLNLDILHDVSIIPILYNYVKYNDSIMKGKNNGWKGICRGSDEI